MSSKAKQQAEPTPCPTCGQMVAPKPKQRGRPRVVQDYKEQKRLYNQRYYQKVRERVRNDLEPIPAEPVEAEPSPQNP